MSTKIFVNLPVQDLERSKEFFTKIGFTINPDFTDERAACVVFGEDIYAMLLTHEFFKTFVKKEIADTNKTVEVINALSTDSKELVDELANKALESGATQYREPEDHGWMYGRSFEDLDGHLWEVFYMDLNAVPKNINNGQS